jgi:hypothetical protein
MYKSLIFINLGHCQVQSCDLFSSFLRPSFIIIKDIPGKEPACAIRKHSNFIRLSQMLFYIRQHGLKFFPRLIDQIRQLLDLVDLVSDLTDVVSHIYNSLSPMDLRAVYQSLTS